MQRGSDKHSARMDYALEAEVDGMMRAGRDIRAMRGDLIFGPAFAPAASQPGFVSDLVEAAA